MFSAGVRRATATWRAVTPLRGAPVAAVRMPTVTAARALSTQSRVVMSENDDDWKKKGPIGDDEVHKVQEEWARGIKDITIEYRKGDEGDFKGKAIEVAEALYGYDQFDDVLFKPTKAVEDPFRPDKAGALSYFIGGRAARGYVEDGGFAINGGDGWDEVSFKNHKIAQVTREVTVAMGEYHFWSDNGPSAKVEYTFGYKRDSDGRPRIFLHHSSAPYSKPKKTDKDGDECDKKTDKDGDECDKKTDKDGDE